jgi:hypothetical protein
VAKMGGDGWLKWGRWVAKLVERLLATARQLAGFESRHKQRSGQHTVASQKIYKKEEYSIRMLLARGDIHRRITVLKKL